MKQHLIQGLGLVLLASGCASNSVVTDDHATKQPYHYGGEKYGRVTLEYSAEVGEDSRVISRAREAGLDSAIVNHLIAHGLYDPKSANLIEVKILKFSFAKDAFVAWGNRIDAVVTLKNGGAEPLASFVVNTKVFFSKGDGGIDDTLGALRRNFGELTAKTIEQKDQEIAGTAAKS